MLETLPGHGPGGGRYLLYGPFRLTWQRSELEALLIQQYLGLDTGGAVDALMCHTLKPWAYVSVGRCHVQPQASLG